MKRLVLIDGMSVFYRGYFAMPGLSLPDGTPTGGVFGFASIAVEVIKQLEPDYVTVAWDKPKTATRKRKEIYPEYKAGRAIPPDDFYAQIPLLHDLLESFGWPVLEMDDYEADDIIGTISVEAAKKGIETCVVSGDYDMMQLLSPHTSVYINKKGAEMMHFTEKEFEQKYGVKLAQFVDYKALVGDSSDNIPGVRGIGPKAAEKLLGEYGSLDGIYEHINELKGAQKTKLEENKDNAYMSRELARIYCDIPVELDWYAADVHNTDLPAIVTKLHELEFNSLVKRLPKHMQLDPEFALAVDAPVLEIREVQWPDMLQINGPVVAYVHDGELWLSLKEGKVMKADARMLDASVWRALSFATVISHDSKQLYHQLADVGVTVKFEALYDVHQAAFLIDPLRRDRSLSALIGGPVETPGETVAASWQIYDWQQQALQELPQVKQVAETMDFPLSYTLFQMERRGIAVDVKQLQQMSKELGKQLAELEQKMYTLAGREFNIASPSQLAIVLFEDLGLPTIGIKKGKNGYSTDAKTLAKLHGQHELIELIEQTRELAKLRNTYLDTLPEQIGEDGRIHTTYSQDVAATGRLSSNHPNLQNIPIRSDIGRKIRDAFIPTKGKVFVSADYSQFELRLAAVLAGDQQLINDFNAGLDIHAKTASDVYGIPLDEVTKAQRRDAKVINFGVLYGMSPHGLAEATGMTFGAAKQFIDQYFEIRKPIRAYIDKTLQQARDEGYVETYFGRRRPTPDIKSSNYMVRSGAERAAANMPIQGTEADLMKIAMLRVDEKLGNLGEQILQIHDSILVECPQENAEKVSELLKETMENVAPDLPVKLQVDVHTGNSWGEV